MTGLQALALLSLAINVCCLALSAWCLVRERRAQRKLGQVTVAAMDTVAHLNSMHMRELNLVKAELRRGYQWQQPPESRPN